MSMMYYCVSARLASFSYYFGRGKHCVWMPPTTTPRVPSLHVSNVFSAKVRAYQCKQTYPKVRMN